MSWIALHAKSRQQDQQVRTRNEAIAVDILRTVCVTAEFAEQPEQVVNRRDAVLVDVAGTRRELSAGDEAVAIDITTEWCQRCLWVEVGVAVMAVVGVGDPAWRGHAAEALSGPRGIVSIAVSVGIWPCQRREETAVVIFGSTGEEVAGIGVRTPGEFIAVTDPIAIGIAAETISRAVESLFRESTRAIVTEREQVEVAGRRMGAAGSGDAGAVSQRSGGVKVAREAVGATIAREIACRRPIGERVEVAGRGQHAARVGHRWKAYLTLEHAAEVGVELVEQGIAKAGQGDGCPEFWAGSPTIG